MSIEQRRFMLRVILQKNDFLALNLFIVEISDLIRDRHREPVPIEHEAMIGHQREILQLELLRGRAIEERWVRRPRSFEVIVPQKEALTRKRIFVRH